MRDDGFDDQSRREGGLTPIQSTTLSLLQEGAPSFSAALLEPFDRVLAELPADVRSSIPSIRIERGTRISSVRALEALRLCVETLRNPDLGIAAGLQVSAGTFGVTDYAMHAASDLRHALATLSANARLISDTFIPRLERVGEKQVCLQLQAAASSRPRAAGDFSVCGFYTNHLRTLGRGAIREVWFAHPRPDDIRAYEAAMVDLPLRFGAPCYGFLLSLDALDTPLPGRDVAIHSLMSAHADIMRSQVDLHTRFAHRVRELVLASLTDVRPMTSKRASRRLHVSTRTLERRLREEGTSFVTERDVVFRRLAVEYLLRTPIEVRELASVLGFAHVQGFHRAFKRWTGEAPAEYRSRHLKR